MASTCAWKLHLHLSVKQMTTTLSTASTSTHSHHLCKSVSRNQCFVSAVNIKSALIFSAIYYVVVQSNGENHSVKYTHYHCTSKTYLYKLQLLLYILRDHSTRSCMQQLSQLPMREEIYQILIRQTALQHTSYYRNVYFTC